MAEKTFVYRGTNFIKVGLELILRSIFADPNIVDSRYRYVIPTTKGNPDPDNKIAIYRTNSNRVEFYPALIISAGAHDTNLTALGTDVEEEPSGEDDGEEVQTAGGWKIVPITIRVLAKSSSDDRDNLTDILEQIFRTLARGEFNRLGIGFTHISIAGDSETEGDDGNIIYENAVTIECNTDYWRILPYDHSSDINKVAIKVFGQLTDGSPEVPLHPFN